MNRLTMFLSLVFIVLAGCRERVSQETEAPPAQESALDQQSEVHSEQTTPELDELKQAAAVRATEEGLSPIGVKMEGSSLIAVAGELTISDGKMGFQNGDMLYNVGSDQITFAGKLTATGVDVILELGECAVIRNGKFEKLPGRLAP